MATADGKSSTGTMDRSIPAAAGLKTDENVPSTNATMGICQYGSTSSPRVRAMLPTATARNASEMIISALRLKRSDRTPENGPNNTAGAIRVKDTTPASAGEWVMASTTSG